MKVIRESGGEHGDCLMSYVDFESTVLGFPEDITLFWGYQTPFNKELIDKTITIVIRARISLLTNT